MYRDVNNEVAVAVAVAVAVDDNDKDNDDHTMLPVLTVLYIVDR